MTAIVMVRVRCPYGHRLPNQVRVPEGTPVIFRCLQCGREFEATAL